MIGRLHKWLGALLMLPLLGWCVTGAIFLIKPGYGDAYTPLEPRLYPLSGMGVPGIGVPGMGLPALPSDAFDVRLVHTILGRHLLLKTAHGWKQYDPQSLVERQAPPAVDMIRLLEDAITVNPGRYGKIVEKRNGEYITETGVKLTPDWNTLTLAQRGRDRALIDNLYNVHYLRWTNIQAVDNMLGISGLLCLTFSTLLGGRLLFTRRG
jgi:hypothetical protein